MIKRALMVILFFATPCWSNRLWQSGFETGSSNEWEAVSAPVTYFSSAAYTGDYGARFIHSTRCGLIQSWSAADLSSPYKVRMRFRYESLPNAESGIFAMNTAGAAISSTISAILMIDQNGRLISYDVGSVMIGSSTVQLSTGTWYRIEALHDTSSGAGAQKWSVLLDGTTLWSNGTLSSLKNCRSFRIGGNMWGAGGVTRGESYMDDIAVNDSSGTYQTGFPGDTRIKHLRPNGPGDNNQWKLLTGGGSATNYMALDEVAPNDATDYAVKNAVGSYIDDYRVQRSSDVGIVSTNTINVIAVSGRIGATSATATGRDGKFRIKPSAGGVAADSGIVDWSVSGWMANSDPVPRNLKLVTYRNNYSSAAWTTTDLDVLQIGISNATSSANETRASTLWASVDYDELTPPAAPGGGGGNVRRRIIIAD